VDATGGGGATEGCERNSACRWLREREVKVEPSSVGAELVRARILGDELLI